MPTWTILYFWAFWPLLGLICVGCARNGDPTVCSVAAVFGGAMLADLFTLPWRNWDHLVTFLGAVDIVLLLCLIVIALRSPRWWLMAMTALQLLAVLGHLAKIMIPAMSRLTYAVLVGGGSYFQLILLSVGLLLNIRGRRLTTRHHA